MSFSLRRGEHQVAATFSSCGHSDVKTSATWPDVGIDSGKAVGSLPMRGGLPLRRSGERLHAELPNGIPP